MWRTEGVIFGLLVTDQNHRCIIQTGIDEMRLNVAQMVCIIYKQDTNGTKNLDFSGFGVIKEIIKIQKIKITESLENLVFSRFFVCFGF